MSNLHLKLNLEDKFSHSVHRMQYRIGGIDVKPHSIMPEHSSMYFRGDAFTKPYLVLPLGRYLEFMLSFEAGEYKDEPYKLCLSWKRTDTVGMMIAYAKNKINDYIDKTY